MLHDLPNRVLSEPRAAEYIGVSSKTLKRKRASGDFDVPAILLSPHRRGYRVSDLDAWIEARIER